MHKLSHAVPGAPSAWRGLQTSTSSRKTLGESVAREFQEHPWQTLGFIAAAIALARLALAPSKKERPEEAETKLAARRRTGH